MPIAHHGGLFRRWPRGVGVINRADRRAGERFPAMHRRVPARKMRQIENPDPRRRRPAIAPAFGFVGWEDLGSLAFLVAYGLLMWRLAIRAMTRKLID